LRNIPELESSGVVLSWLSKKSILLLPKESIPYVILASLISKFSISYIPFNAGTDLIDI